MHNVFKHKWVKQLVSGFLLAAICLPLVRSQAVHAGAEALEIPEGFTEIRSAPGVSLYRKEYAGGRPDYVQAASLKAGASIELLHGTIADPGKGGGSYGGDNPTFARETVDQVWQEYSPANPNLFCLTNGGFFSTNAAPTPLAFPLKVDGRILSDGYGGGEFPDQNLMLEIWEDHVDINPLSGEALSASSAPDILAGLSETADKGAGSYVQRTFIGIADADQNDSYETVLVFNSEMATQPGAAGILRSFGAEKVIMLDGGGSTQLFCEGESYIYTSRTVPQTVAVYSKPQPPYALEVSEQPQWPIVVEGETLEIRLVVENTGTQTWIAGQTSLVNRQNPWGAQTEMVMGSDVSPGGTAAFSWTSEAFEKSGVFTSSWRMVQNGEDFEDGEVSINVIVIPKALADKKAELEQKVQEWLDEKEAELKDLIIQWIQEQTEKAARGLLDKICGGANGAVVIGVLGLVIQRKMRKDRLQ